jgi:hypothetical protein
VSIDDVLGDPQTWWKKGLRSDRDLLENNMAFDLGLDKSASHDDVDELISRMDTWALVMITEYMDESLVILKRTMCWSIDDVAYYALKVNSAKKKAGDHYPTHRHVLCVQPPCLLPKPPVL